MGRTLFIAFIILCVGGAVTVVYIVQNPRRVVLRQDFTVPALNFTIGWKDEPYTVPPPPVVPEEIYQSREYRKWRQIGNITQFTHTDASGSRWVARALGVAKQKDGTLREFIDQVARYRPDGTLDAMTSCISGEIDEWTYYAADGKTKVLRVAPDDTPKGTRIRIIGYYENDVPARMYEVNKNGIIYSEFRTDEHGGLTGDPINLAPRRPQVQDQ